MRLKFKEVDQPPHEVVIGQKAPADLHLRAPSVCLNISIQAANSGRGSVIQCSKVYSFSHYCFRLAAQIAHHQDEESQAQSR